jgi:peptidoglycan/xylan/chitin deacetylase (PgdA/CDA1 family)
MDALAATGLLSGRALRSAGLSVANLRRGPAFKLAANSLKPSFTVPESRACPGAAVEPKHRRILVLNLHGLGNPPRALPLSEQRVWLGQASFESMLDYVQAEDQVWLTFDDSNESDYTIALPALQRRGMKAQFFIVVDRVGQPGYLSRGHLGALVAAGMSIGNHGMRHRPWVGLSDAALHEETVEARDRLEQMAGVSVEHASCPFGSYNRRVIRKLRGAGYTRLYTSDGGPSCEDGWLVPRTTMEATWDMSNFQAVLLDRRSTISKVWRQMKRLLKQWR